MGNTRQTVKGPPGMRGCSSVLLALHLLPNLPLVAGESKRGGLESGRDAVLGVPIAGVWR